LGYVLQVLAAVDTGCHRMDPKSSFLLEIKLLANPRTCRKDCKMFSFAKDEGTALSMTYLPSQISEPATKKKGKVLNQTQLEQSSPSQVPAPINLRSTVIKHRSCCCCHYQGDREGCSKETA
ncbi:hypothetical protein EJB05_26915, partial [Eragrostis curvula]